ncbi:hypothetical protein V495_05729 [Pseudogymnoascus sp. VKM F-4514 (FW-929)]|nr:hypothetical protein V495_05729 [Pseudogymnoascus sp. VKM F-4514 (FW-929)]KFY52129.1 hypothetical protein V497_08630 [Pseudogymnoascus sp. VKM F-4516 (FW-969)]
MKRASQIALIALCAQVATAVTPLIIKGTDFVNSVSGERFQVIGAAYQPGGEAGYKPETGKDPLSDGDICLRDAALLQRIGVNTIRVYNLSPDINHDECASIFNIAGIYMMIDVNTPKPNEALSREAPWESYNHDYLERTFKIVEAFKNYPNTALFFSANEVINDVPTAITVPYIRAVTRDLKQYIKNHVDRPIPVGYSAADVREVLVDTFNYLQCTTTGDATDMSISDLFALNSYSWCGKATFEEAGYNKLVDMFKTSSTPVFMSEYGCREIRPRVFDEVAALYSSKMAPYFSGGVVYEFSQEKNDFGLVVLNSDGSAKLKTDYDNFASQLGKLNITALQSTEASAKAAPFPKCEASLIKDKGFPNDFSKVPSPPNDGLAALIKAGVKSPKNGKIITIDNLKVKQVVKNSDDSVITGLEVKRLTDGNVPTQTSGSPAPTGTSSSPEETSSSAAVGTKQLGGFGFVMSSLLTALYLI